MTDTPLLDWKQAESRRDLGMSRAVDHADRADAGWSDRAYAALVEFAAGHEEFTAEAARQAMHDAGLAHPPDGRAWGAVFKRAASKRLIVKVGYAPRACGNMTPTIVWRAT